MEVHLQSGSIFQPAMLDYQSVIQAVFSAIPRSAAGRHLKVSKNPKVVRLCDQDRMLAFFLAPNKVAGYQTSCQKAAKKKGFDEG